LAINVVNTVWVWSYFLQTVVIDHCICFSGIVCKAGDKRDAVVLHIDSVARCVQLTLNKDTLKAVRAFKENKFTQVFIIIFTS